MTFPIDKAAALPRGTKKTTSPDAPRTTKPVTALARPNRFLAWLRRLFAPKPPAALADVASAYDAVVYAVAMGKTVDEGDRIEPLATIMWKLEGAEKALKRAREALEGQVP